MECRMQDPRFALIVVACRADLLLNHTHNPVQLTWQPLMVVVIIVHGYCRFCSFNISFVHDLL